MSTMINPGQVNCGLNQINNEQKQIPSTMYKAGNSGYPNALYGRSALGKRFRRIKIPPMVST